MKRKNGGKEKRRFQKTIHWMFGLVQFDIRSTETVRNQINKFSLRRRSLWTKSNTTKKHLMGDRDAQTIKQRGNG